MNRFTSTVLIGIQAATALKIVTLSDPHMMPQYDPYNGSNGFCWDDSGAEPLEYPAFFGQVGCDPPVELVRIMLDKFSTEHPDADVMLLTGDIVAHAVALEPPPKSPYSHASYGDVLGILANFSNLLHEYFPNTVILPTQGNNDDKYHY